MALVGGAWVLIGQTLGLRSLLFGLIMTVCTSGKRGTRPWSMCSRSTSCPKVDAISHEPSHLVFHLVQIFERPRVRACRC